jgi:hypothetical protein
MAPRTSFGAAALYALATAFPAAAHAFSDPLSYDQPPDLGGGGGRWFTGSSADGYGCEVCHQGGKPAELTVTGLPIDGFVPGSAYEVTVNWPLGTEHISLIAELMDEQRVTAGTVALPRPDALHPPELCSGDQMGFPASRVHESEAGRELLSVIDCGALSVRFQWTAPAVVAGPIWFNLGFVAGDGDASPFGDGVTMVRHPLTVMGKSAGTRAVAEGSCAVAAPRAQRPRGLAALLCLATLSIGLRTRVRAGKKVER